jgi:hypothetical protein
VEFADGRNFFFFFKFTTFKEEQQKLWSGVEEYSSRPTH